MKKIIVLIMTAVLMLTACGKEETVESGRERIREERTEAGGEEPAEDSKKESDKSEDAGKEQKSGEDEKDTGKQTDEPADGGASAEANGSFSDRANADTWTGSIKELSEGDVAPDFTAELVNGSSFRLSDHDDKVVLINFWATWCGPCVREMPAFEMLMADNMDGFELVCVNCMDDKDTVDSFVKDAGYGFNIAYDTDGRIETYYPTDGIPYTLIVDHGIISKIYVGAMDAETQYREYKAAIEDAMR